MKVLNLWGGPGTGKSTTAAGLFYAIKKTGANVELVGEYAKDLVYDRRTNILGDQIYIFAKQQRRIARLADHHMEWVITDSPIPLGLVYTQPGTLSDHFDQLVMEVFNQYENYNFLLQRNVIYNPVGRNQKNEQEAREFDHKVCELVAKHNINIENVVGGEPAVNTILQRIGFGSLTTP
jgi:AAA domain